MATGCVAAVLVPVLLVGAVTECPGDGVSSGSQGPGASTTTTTGPKFGPESEAAKKANEAWLAAWQRELRAVARIEKASLFASVPVYMPPRIPYKAATGESGMKTLAALMNARWEQVAGIQTFRPGSRSLAQDSAAAVEWLMGLPDEGLRELLRGKRVDEVDGVAARDLLRRVGATDPSAAAVHLDRAGDVEAKILIGMAITVRDPATGRERDGGSMISPPSNREAAGAAAADETAVTPLAVPEPGEFDLGEGAVLTLRELASKASAAFGVRYRVDQRMVGDVYFVSGSYSRRAFEGALGVATAIVPVHVDALPNTDRAGAAEALCERLRRVVAGDLDITDLRMGIPSRGSTDSDALVARYGERETLPLDVLYSSEFIDPAAIAEGRPGLADFFSRHGVGPGDLVSFRPRALLWVGCRPDAGAKPGTRRSTYGATTVHLR